MKKYRCVASLLLIVLVQTMCEGKSLEEFDDVQGFEEDQELRDLIFVHGQLSDEANGKYCTCNSIDCRCCYMISGYQVCTSTKLVMLEEEGENIFAIRGQIMLNETNLFLYYFRLKDIPKMCYDFKYFITCVEPKQRYLNDTTMQVCWHIQSSYTSAVLLNVDLFCRSFEIKKKEDKPVPKNEEKEFFSIEESEYNPRF